MRKANPNRIGRSDFMKNLGMAVGRYEGEGIQQLTEAIHATWQQRATNKWRE
jgi:hypothetical protein